LVEIEGLETFLHEWHDVAATVQGMRDLAVETVPRRFEVDKGASRQNDQEVIAGRDLREDIGLTIVVRGVRFHEDVVAVHYEVVGHSAHEEARDSVPV